MHILIAGGSGFIGQALSAFLQRAGFDVAVLSRKPGIPDIPNQVHWDGKALCYNKPVDTIINLCGLNIAAKRWSTAVKQQLRDSRLQPTQAIVDYIQQLPAHKRPSLINASAIGFYPNSAAQQTEVAFLEKDAYLFCQTLVNDWEKAAQSCRDTHVTCVRFGVVMDPKGGMLKKLLPSYRLGLGSILGNGSMHLSWITLRDLCRALTFIMLLDNPKPIYNVTAPVACTQATFSKTLARALHRPCFLRLPACLVQGMFGQMGRELLLADQVIYPQHLIEAGFEFEYPDIDSAIASMFS